MAFATDSDVQDTLGRPLTATENDVVDSLLDRATDLVIGYGVNPDPVPGAVRRVVAEMVTAVFQKPSINVADYDANGYRTTSEAAIVRVGAESITTSGPWLSASQKMRLNPYRSGGLNEIALKSESDMSKDVWPPQSEIYNSDI